MSDELVVVGKITKAHGVRGEVSVLVLSEVPGRFDPGSVVLLDDRRKLTITSTRTDRGHLLVCFEGVGDREAARELTGRFVHVTVADLPELPEGSWWPHQIEGCEVSFDDGRELGVVSEVIANPANDIWVVVAPDGREVLVPVLKGLLVSVDVEARRIVIREMPGLLE